MTIERLSFPEGVKIESDVHAQLLRLVREHADEVAQLAEGDYDLTPTWWTKHLHNHHLTVMADGTGIYRAIPRESDVGTGDPRTGSFQRGGRLIRIPQDQAIAMIGGPLKDLRNLGIYEIVFHLPGPSPRATQ